MAVIGGRGEARIAGYGVDGGHLRNLNRCHHVGDVFDFVEKIIVTTIRFWSGNAKLSTLNEYSRSV